MGDEHTMDRRYGGGHFWMWIAATAPVASGGVVIAAGVTRATILLMIGAVMNSVGILGAQRPSGSDRSVAGHSSPTTSRSDLTDGSPGTDHARAVTEQPLVDGQTNLGSVDLSIAGLAA